MSASVDALLERVESEFQRLESFMSTSETRQRQLIFELDQQLSTVKVALDRGGGDQMCKFFFSRGKNYEQNRIRVYHN
jgi:hypothetical protein